MLECVHGRTFQPSLMFVGKASLTHKHNTLMERLGIETLAYYKDLQITDVKSFKTLGTECLTQKQNDHWKSRC